VTIYWYIYRERRGYKKEIFERRGILVGSSEKCDIASLMSGSRRTFGPLKVKTILFFETCGIV
jgi:hypothetical protein